MTHSSPVLPLISINRYRMGIDGKGITTLVGAAGCPLGCRYCLNPEVLKPDTRVRYITPEELLNLVKADNLYYLATGGGITFGGGESLLHTSFILKFRRICSPFWNLTAETSLQIPSSALERVLDAVNYFIVDIKDLDPDTYHAYTGKDNSLVLNNLKLLRQSIAPGRIKVRVPYIPGYNTEAAASENGSRLREMGFEEVEVFSYIIRDGKTPPINSPDTSPHLPV